MLRNVISVIDGEAGSCGKAKVIGEIATDPSIRLGAAVTNCMPNAGHTFVSEEGKKTVFQNIPVSSVNPDTELFIGPGSAIDMESFAHEYAEAEHYLGDRKIYVHEMVPLIEERHKETERKLIKSGSTFKGCGAVSQEKIMRDAKLEFFKTFKNAVVCSNAEWLDRLYRHLDDPYEYVLLEGAQGCDLDLNHSGNYPYVTSRNVSTSQLLADCGISPERLLQTIMTIRPFPIRINNIATTGDIIYTGSYGNGSELYWSEINVAYLYGGYPHKGMLDVYSNNLNAKLVKKLMSHCPEIYLRQLFGDDYRRLDPAYVEIAEAMELERLMYKSKGIHDYTTRLLDLPIISHDIAPNEIRDKSEQTTVSKRERRIFDLDFRKLANNCRINTPSSLYLNFFEHLGGYEFEGRTGNFDDYYFDKYLREYFAVLEDETKTPICALGTGARNGERILKMNPIKPIEHN